MTNRITTVRRIWVKLISSQALNQLMAYHGETNRSLAMKTGPGVGRQIIGHLRSGERTTCSPKTARAIAEALHTPVGVLFVPSMPSGEVATPHRRNAA